MILTGVGSRLQTWGGLAAQWSDSTLRTYVATVMAQGIERSGGSAGTLSAMLLAGSPLSSLLLPTQCA
jgi:hypothetical protein